MPRQGVVTNMLNLFRNGAVDLIDWLRLWWPRKQARDQSDPRSGYRPVWTASRKGLHPPSHNASANIPAPQTSKATPVAQPIQ